MQTTPNFEPHSSDSQEKLNKLRASVLGANDGIVSTAALIVGIAGASNTTGFILTAGVAGLISGALSMGVGEYISVSAQRDSEKILIQKEYNESLTQPEFELEELTTLYAKKGLSRPTAELVAKELTAHDALGAHLDAELHIDQTKLINPWNAAFASAASFVVGAIIPIAMMAIAPANIRIHITFLGVLLALIATGTLSAYAGGANKKRAVVRVVFGGLLAMAITFGIGSIFGVTVS